MKTANRNRAFTLVELLMAAAVASILILITAAVLLMAYRSWSTNNAYVRLRSDAAFAIELIARDIREAQRPTGVSITPNTLTINNVARPYVAVFTFNPATGILSYTRDGNPAVPVVAQNVTAFEPETHEYEASVDGVNLFLEMANDGVTLTNETFVYMRN